MRARSSKKKRTIKQKYNNKKERNASLVRARILQRLHLRKRQSTPSMANNPQPKPEQPTISKVLSKSLCAIAKANQL